MMSGRTMLIDFTLKVLELFIIKLRNLNMNPISICNNSIVVPIVGSSSYDDFIMIWDGKILNSEKPTANIVLLKLRRMKML